MRRNLLIAAAISLLVIFATGGWLLTRKDKEAPPVVFKAQSFEDKAMSLKFQYIQPLSVGMLTEQDKKDKFIARLSSTNPAMLVSVRYEDGLRIVANLAHVDTLDYLLQSADKALPARYKDYRLISDRKLSVGNKKAAETTFTYTGPNGEKARQRFLTIIKDDNTAIYISAQSSDSDYEAINRDYFDQLFNSISFN